MLQPQNITEFYINSLKNGSVVIDATAGNGFDTLKLCRAVGDRGKVYAFDIQNQALDETAKKLRAEGLGNAKLICDSHSRLDLYIQEQVDEYLESNNWLNGQRDIRGEERDLILADLNRITGEDFKQPKSLLGNFGYLLTIYGKKKSSPADIVKIPVGVVAGVS